MKTLVVHHSADYDGIFCREIARKFIPDAEFVGWDFPDQPVNPEPIATGDYDQIFVMDLPLDKPFGLNQGKTLFCNGLVWIDHHRTAIETHDSAIPGYRIDGVAACRLAWQWFSHRIANDVMSDSRYLPEKKDFLVRSVDEPLAVRLAGEYDVWDHRGDGDVEFQFGLDAQRQIPWSILFEGNTGRNKEMVNQIIGDGQSAMRCYAKRDADVIRARGFKLRWEGLNFLALNTPRCNSQSFAALDVPETGHDALMAFYFDGKMWNFSLYHATHYRTLNLSLIAKRYGGGGHAGACGFRLPHLPFDTYGDCCATPETHHTAI